WQIVAPVLRNATRQPGQVPRRAILNAIFYVLRTGCQWRFLPVSYPNWKTVYSCFRRWSLNGTWDQVVDALRVQVRYEQGRKALPTAAVIDTQSVKTTEKGGDAATMEPRKSKGASESNCAT
ncbi:transposase, partial [bacterium]